MARVCFHPEPFGLAKQLLALIAGMVCVASCLYAQGTAPVDASGDWIVVFGDSVSAGTLAMHLNQDAGGHLTGDYRTTLGGIGMATGQIEGSTISLTLTQTVAQCPGSYHSSVTLANGAGSGTFTGRDCLGVHDDGVVSIHRKSAETAPPAAVTRDKDGSLLPYALDYENGQPFWLSRSDAAFLAVAGEEVEGYFRLTVIVSNSSDKPIVFFPEAIQVRDLNSGKLLPYTSPEKIAQRIRRRAAIAAGLMAFGNGMQAYSHSMVTVHTTGTLSMYSNQGDWAQGSFYGTATARVPVDTAQLRTQDAQDSAMIAARANRKIANLTGAAARAQTLAPKTYIVGNVMFPRGKVKDMKEMTGRKFKSYFVQVNVPVGGENFQYVFPVELLKASAHQVNAR